jgi:hypothetical protein
LWEKVDRLDVHGSFAILGKHGYPPKISTHDFNINLFRRDIAENDVSDYRQWCYTASVAAIHQLLLLLGTDRSSLVSDDLLEGFQDPTCIAAYRLQEYICDFN